MEHRTVKEKYTDWSEKRLGAEELDNVRKHLDGCDDCRGYYEKMSLLIDGTDPALLPRLTPDPYLPARIRALVGGRKTEPVRRRAHSWLQAALTGLMLVAAATAGVYIGQGLSSRNASGESVDIAEAYYEAFSPTDFSGTWETVLSDSDANGGDR